MGGLFVFDLTDKSSFETLYKYVKESNSYSESGMVKILVGNKVDLKENREVTQDEAEEFAQKNGMAYVETSAVTGEKVNMVFDMLIKGN